MSSSTTPLVSVVVPIYKVETYLRECLDSIRNQSYSNLDIILVDDGSPDNCPKICDTYAELDNRIRVIHKKNSGVSDTRNVGIQLANGTKIVFVDSDDIIAPHMIETLLRNCPDERSVAAIDFLRFANGEQPCGTESSEKQVFSDIRSFTRRRGGMFSWGILYDRCLIQKLGLRFDTDLNNLEDVAWNVAYLAHVDKMYFVPGKMYYYRQNPTSITSRCNDKAWQVRCWFASRNSIFHWFAKRGEKNTVALRFAWRYCMNNIFAESICGGLTYSAYADKRVLLPKSNVFLAEVYLERLFPRLYYAGYINMMRFRNYIHR